LQQIDGVISEKEIQITALKKELEKLSVEMDSTYRLYLDKQITSEGFGQRYLPMEEQKAQIEKEVPKLQAEADILRINLVSSDENLHRAVELYGSWSELSFQEKRSIVEAIVSRIEVGKGEIDITLLYLPTSKDVAKEHRNFRGSWRRPA